MLTWACVAVMKLGSKTTPDFEFPGLVFMGAMVLDTLICVNIAVALGGK